MRGPGHLPFPERTTLKELEEVRGQGLGEEEVTARRSWDVGISDRGHVCLARLPRVPQTWGPTVAEDF